MSSRAADYSLCLHLKHSVVCRYLVHMVQLDAAAMNLKRRFEDPNITASLEAQQAYTRALAPGGDLLPSPLHCTVSALRLPPASYYQLQAKEMHFALLGARRLCQGSTLFGLSGALIRLKHGKLLRASLQMVV